MEERLKKEFGSTQIGRWNLELRQFRSTVQSADAASRGGVAAPSFLQVLSMSTRDGPPAVTVTTTIEAQPQTSIAIPPDQTENFLQLIASKLGGLWTPRPPLQVFRGSVFDLGEFLVRVGELRQAGSQNALRGLIVIIEEVDLAAQSEEYTAKNGSCSAGDANGIGINSTISRDMLRSIWNSVHIEGAKEFIRAVPRDPEATRFDEAQHCCEALRLRS